MYGSSAATSAAMTAESHHHQGSGLLRYRSAPTSLLSELCEDFLPVNRPPSSPETDAMLFARFLSSDPRDEHPRSSAAAAASGSGQRNPQLPPQPPPPPAAAAQEENRIGTSMGFPSAAAASASEMMMYQQLQNQNGGGNVCSNLIRHSSSPAGFFSHLNVLENGFEVMRGINHEFKGQGQLMSFSSKQRQSSSSAAAGLMPQILDIENESIGIGGGGYHPMASWGEEEDDDNIFSALLNDNNNNMRPRRRRDDNQTQLNTTRNREARNDGGRLARHLSLPTTSFSSEMAAIDNFVQFQDSVPCKIRAKRGCATHPRSIAERVRRTRISERMRKLQELVPNMDKQTNTADMLDLSVDYIKDLQEQVKTLTNKRAGCTCSSSSNKQNQFSGLAV